MASAAQRDAILSKYISTLCDPWSFGPVRLGWGTFSPTGLHTAFLRVRGTPIANQMVFKMNPLFYTAASVGQYNGFCSVFQPVGAGTALNTVGVPITQFGSQNYAYLASVIQSARVVSAAMRVTAAYPATSARPNLTGLCIGREVPLNVYSQSVTTLQSFNASRWAQSNSAGNVGIEVQYRPLDPEDYIFYNAGNVPINQAENNNMIVTLSDIPANCYWTLEIIVHYETISGLDGPGDDALNETDTMSMSGVTMDMAGSLAAREQPVIPSITAIEMLDRGLETAANSLSRTGMGRMRSFSSSARNEGTAINGTIVQPSALTCTSLPGECSTPPNTAMDEEFVDCATHRRFTQAVRLR